MWAKSWWSCFPQRVWKRWAWCHVSHTVSSCQRSGTRSVSWMRVGGGQDSTRPSCLTLSIFGSWERQTPRGLQPHYFRLSAPLTAIACWTLSIEYYHPWQCCLSFDYQSLQGYCFKWRRKHHLDSRHCLGTLIKRRRLDLRQTGCSLLSPLCCLASWSCLELSQRCCHRLWFRARICCS